MAFVGFLAAVVSIWIIKGKDESLAPALTLFNCYMHWKRMAQLLVLRGKLRRFSTSFVVTMWVACIHELL